MVIENTEQQTAVNQATRLSYQWLAGIGVLALTWVLSYTSVIVNNYGLLALYIGLWLVFGTALFVASKRKRKLWLIYLKDESSWKSCLSGGFLMYGLRLIAAAPIAFIFLLNLSTGLQMVQWLILFAMVLLWPFMLGLSQIWSRRNIKDPAQLYVSAGSARVIYGLVFIALFASYSFVAVKLPNLQSLSLPSAFDWGLKTISKEIQPSSDVLTVILGYATALEYSYIWLADYISGQMLDLGLAGSTASFTIKSLIWLVFALKSALFIWPMLILLRSASLLPLFNQDENRFILSMGKWTFAITFIGAIALANFAGPSVNRFWQETRCIAIDTEEACYDVTEAEFNAALDDAFKALSLAQRKIANRLLAKSNRYIDVVFNQAKENVPSYLEWHYSLSGKAMMLIGDSGPDLDNHLFPNGGVKAAYERAAKTLENAMLKEQEGLAKQLKEELTNRLAKHKRHPHASKTKNRINLEVESVFNDFAYLYRQEQTKARLQALGALSVGAGATILAVGGKKGAKVVGKQLAKEGAKQGVKRGATGNASALGCAPLVATGPGMVLCAVTVFVTSTVLFEYLEIKADRYLNEAELRVELLTSLTKTQYAIKNDMKQQVLTLFPESYEVLQKQIAERAFETPLERVIK